MDLAVFEIPIIAFGAVAATGSAISALLSWRVASSNNEFNRHAANLAAASKHEELIAHHPQLLDLHGFSSEDLEALGLTQIEVAYLLASFTAGNLFYQDGKVKELTEYRKVLLQSSKVQVAWEKILMGRFIGEGNFATLVNEYIEVVKSMKIDI